MPWVEGDEVKKMEPTKPLTPFEEEIRKSDKTPIPEYQWEPSFKIREPVYSFEELMLIARTHWVLKQTFHALLREIMSPGYDLKPRFSAKCTECGKEYDYWVEDAKCTAVVGDGKKCGGKLRPPSRDQWERADTLLKHPCRDFTFREITKSAIWYDLALSNYWITVNWRYVKDPASGDIIRIPAEIELQDPRYFRVVADSKGHVGDPKQLFCPKCWVPDVTYSSEERTTCPQCGEPLQKTAYVQRIGGAIKQRFAADEVFHGSSDRLAPQIYGESRIISLWKLLVSMMSMDDFNIELYTEGKLGSIINFPGHDQDEVNEIIRTFEQEALQKRVYDPILRRFRTSKKIRTLMLGSKEKIQVTKVMEDFKSMQSLEFYKFWKSAVQTVYDVTPILVPDPTSGSKGGGSGGTNPVILVSVQNKAIKERQASWEDMVNNRIFPTFGITDWELRFNTLELRDELRHAQVGQIKANTALTWLNAGFKVRINDQGELEISGEGRLQYTKNGAPHRAPVNENMPLESEATGYLRERTGRFAPKPAGDQAEMANLMDEESDELSSGETIRWVNPNPVRQLNQKDRSWSG